MSFIISISISIFIMTVIAGLFIHHAYTHDGKFFTMEDFTDFISSIFKSHESIIIVLLIFLIGVMI